MMGLMFAKPGSFTIADWYQVAVREQVKGVWKVRALAETMTSAKAFAGQFRLSKECCRITRIRVILEASGNGRTGYRVYAERELKTLTGKKAESLFPIESGIIRDVGQRFFAVPVRIELGAILQYAVPQFHPKVSA